MWGYCVVQPHRYYEEQNTTLSRTRQEGGLKYALRRVSRGPVKVLAKIRLVASLQSRSTLVVHAERQALDRGLGA